MNHQPLIINGLIIAIAAGIAACSGTPSEPIDPSASAYPQGQPTEGLPVDPKTQREYLETIPTQDQN